MLKPGGMKAAPLIIDCHTHAWLPEDWAMLRILAPAMDGDMEDDSPYNMTPRFEGSVQNLLRHEKAAGVDRFLLLPASSRPERCPELTRWVADLARHYPEIIGFGALHPRTDDPARDVAEVSELKLSGVKVHSILQRFDPLSKRSLQVFEKVAAAGLVMLMDSMSCRGLAAVKPNLEHWIRDGEDLGLETNPEKIAALCRRFPELKIIAAHMGCLYGWDLLDPILDQDRVYFDLAYVHRLMSPETAVELIRKKGVERVIFGTDAPYRRPENALAWFMDLPLTPGERERILGLNLMELLDNGNRRQF